MGWFKKLDRLTKDSISDATAVFAVLGPLATIIGISLQQVIPGTLSLWALLVIVLAAYVLLVAAIRFMKHRLVKDGITLKICGNSIIVKRGDLFSCSGWKVIPFNEYYDTKVDDVVISKASLNGIFIERYTNDIEKLKFAITTDSASTLPPPVKTEEGRMKYELGTIKRFDGQYLVLAFTHFNDLNEAHLTMADYEQCLMHMWREIARVYAGKQVCIPLLGSGITRFDDFGEKTFQGLLRCLVCTLKASKLSFSAPIIFVLTEKCLKEVDLYELKGME